MDGVWAGLGGAVLLAVLGFLGRRFETAGARAVTAQGEAAEEWQGLAVFQRERAEAAEALVEQLRAEALAKEIAHAREVGGLEQRLEEAGLPIRRRPRVPGEPVRTRETT